MKKTMSGLRSVIFTLLVLGIMSFSSGTVSAQDTLIKKPQKVMKIKLDMDEDGESVSIDTTIFMDEDFDMEKFEEAMKEYDIQMQDMEKCMKEMEFKKQRPPRFHYSCSPEAMRFYGSPEECCKIVRVRPPNRGESLTDVLGNIPMSAVKSYRIKETKTGKRITIDVSDDRFFDRDEDVLIWHGDLAPPPPPPPPKIRKEVIIEKNR